MHAAPSKHAIQVAVEALCTEANMWLHQSDQVQAIAHRADGERLGRLEAGIFQLMVSAYNATADQVTARCREGHQRMADIAAALRQVADTYADEEARNVHQFTNIY
jgi:hypothetical protein